MTLRRALIRLASNLPGDDRRKVLQVLTADASSALEEVRRFPETEALVEEMEDLKARVESGFIKPSLAAEVIQNDFAGELGAMAKLGDITTARDFAALEQAVLQFGKDLLGRNAPRKLVYLRHYLPAIKNLR